MSDVYLGVYRDNHTNGIQVSIEDDLGGYRIFGPTFLGESELLAKRKLTARDVKEISVYLQKTKEEG